MPLSPQAKRILLAKQNPTLALLQMEQEMIDKILAQLKGEMAVMHSSMMEELKSIVKESNPLLEKLSLIKGDKGDGGYIPQKGIDYFTTEEIEAMAQEIFSRIKLPEVKDGITPVAGKDYPTLEQITSFVKSEVSKIKIPESKDGYTPKKGLDYFTSEDIESIIKKVVVQFKELSAEQIAERLNTLEEKVEQTVIKGLKRELQTMRVNISNAKQKGGGGGMGNVVHQTFTLQSSTTSVTLSARPAANGAAIWVYYNGALVSRNTYYTSTNSTTLSLLFTPADNSTLDVVFIRT